VQCLLIQGEWQIARAANSQLLQVNEATDVDEGENITRIFVKNRDSTVILPFRVSNMLSRVSSTNYNEWIGKTKQNA
jgi:hypothetical protein